MGVNGQREIAVVIYICGLICSYLSWGRFIDLIRSKLLRLWINYKPCDMAYGAILVKTTFNLIKSSKCDELPINKRWICCYTCNRREKSGGFPIVSER